MSAGPARPNILGRYALYDAMASGGMAVVHFGRAAGAAGFSRPVAIKRLHPQYARDPEFVSMFLDEARLAARVQHPNVVSTLDVLALEGELFLVLEYVHGESLAGLLVASREAGELTPPPVANAIVCGALRGLHAAHDATDTAGAPLHIVHRDVSPQNVLVGVDGIARVLDFGVAKAVVRAQTTREGQLKGKLKYMAPEQLRGVPLTRTADVYSAAVVLWECLTGERLFAAENEAALFGKVLEGVVAAPSSLRPSLPRTLDAPILRALSRDPTRRFPTAREMAIALEAALQPASPHEVGDWVARMAAPALAQRASSLRAMDIGGFGPASIGARSAPTTPGPTTQTQTHSARARPEETDNTPTGVRAPTSQPATSMGVGAQRLLPPPAVQARRPSQVTLTAVDAGAGTLPAVTSAPSPPRTRHRVAIALAAAGTVAVLGLGSIAFAARASRPIVLGVARSGVGDAAELAYGAAVLVTYDLDAPSGEERASQPAPQEAPTASSQRDGSSPSTPPPRWRPRPRPSPSTSASQALPPARPDCDPPWYEDERGIRRVKRHCLP